MPLISPLMPVPDEIAPLSSYTYKLKRIKKLITLEQIPKSLLLNMRRLKHTGVADCHRPQLSLTVV